MALFAMLLLESDSLLVVRSLDGDPYDFSKLQALACGFLTQIDKRSTSFSHIKRSGNVPVYLLARVVVGSNVSMKWTRNIPYDVTVDNGIFN